MTRRIQVEISDEMYAYLDTLPGSRNAYIEQLIADAAYRRSIAADFVTSGHKTPKRRTQMLNGSEEVDVRDATTIPTSSGDVSQDHGLGPDFSPDAVVDDPYGLGDWSDDTTMTMGSDSESQIEPRARVVKRHPPQPVEDDGLDDIPY